ncbi:hypothetical protein HKD28_04950 [Gluconobacter sp. LMG 1744]|uniref:WcbI family polysaccharide biosynthesis putative acetyltransferase n=1 Tax=Gluconobacter TaxID=441 RepID=UPI00188560BB|nr:WcbI family polysaccharide biosynthesis putative acetyltransferase [Gluconobacter cadivus]MBF0890772.1 hypothetical protein [Gluconobacter cadivus]
MTCRIGFLGNCQVQSYSALTPLMVAGAEVVALDYSRPETREETVRERFVEQLEDCDYIFTQTASFSITNETALRERFGSKVKTIANFYFRGLFPDSCMIGSFGNRLDKPTAINSIVILDAFLRGESEENAAHCFNRENYSRLGLLQAWENSMAEMFRREGSNSVDVPGAALMEQACLRYPAFITMNHPSLALMSEYLEKVFLHSGVIYRSINPVIIEDPLEEHDTTPIDNLVAEMRNLPYRGSGYWRINSLGRRFINRAELISQFYDTYKNTPRRDLVVHSPSDLTQYYSNESNLRFLVDPDAPVIQPPMRASLKRRF